MGIHLSFVYTETRYAFSIFIVYELITAFVRNNLSV